MTDRELFKMALDMILAAIKSGDWKVDGACDPDIVIEALRARLAQHEPEPVAYLCENAVGHKYFRWKKPPSTYKPIALYTAPPQREWINLTVQEREKLRDEYGDNPSGLISVVQMMLKEKNG